MSHSRALVIKKKLCTLLKYFSDSSIVGISAPRLLLHEHAHPFCVVEYKVHHAQHRCIVIHSFVMILLGRILHKKS